MNKEEKIKLLKSFITDDMTLINNKNKEFEKEDNYLNKTKLLLEIKSQSNVLIDKVILLLVEIDKGNSSNE